MHNKYGKDILNLSQWMCHTFTVVGVVHSSYLCSVHNQQGRVRSCPCHLTSIVCMPSILDFFIHYAKLYQWLSSLHLFYSFYYATTSSVHVYLLFE